MAYKQDLEDRVLLEEEEELEAEEDDPTTLRKFRYCNCPAFWRFKTCWGIICCLALVPLILFMMMAFSLTASLHRADRLWIQYLNEPPLSVRTNASRLIDRADVIAAKLIADGSTIGFPPELDLVCSGGGSLSMYFLGVHQVLKALERRGVTKVNRMSGASGGTDVAFRLGLMKDEAAVAGQNLAYAKVQEESPRAFGQFKNVVLANMMGEYGPGMKAVLAADHHWRLLGRFLVNRYEAELPSLNNRVFVSVTVFYPYPQNKLVSHFDNKKEAWEAYIMTGSFFLVPDAVLMNEGTYQGKIACDGGLTDCTPHFRDNRSMQLVVVITKLLDGSPAYKMDGADIIVMGKFDTAQAIELMEKGQNQFFDWMNHSGWKTNDEMFQLKDEATDWPRTDCYGDANKEIGVVIAMSILGQFALVFGCICGGCMLGQRLGEDYDVRHAEEHSRANFRKRLNSKMRGLRTMGANPRDLE